MRARAPSRSRVVVGACWANPADPVPAPHLTVIVVSYETRDLTLACLASLYETTAPDPPEVVVVDNASTDGSATAIAERFPQVTLIALDENLGFARACNLGAERSSGEQILLLNPDTIVRPGAIAAISRDLDAHPEAGILGGRTFDENGALNPTSCWGRPTPWSLLCMGIGLSSLFRGSRLFDPEALGGWERDDEREVDIVTGCLLLIRRDLWEELGGFDGDFFMYGEDADLSLRARALGARPRLCPAAEIVHVMGASERIRADKMVRLFRAKARLFLKHWTRPAARFGVAMLGLAAFLRACVHGVAGLVSSKRRESFRTWREIWRRRREWRLGRLIDGPRVLAVASGGGHWIQLRRLLPAFEGARVSFLTVDPALAADVDADRFYDGERREHVDQGTAPGQRDPRGLGRPATPAGRGGLDRRGPRLLRDPVRSPARSPHDLGRQHRERREAVDVRTTGRAVRRPVVDAVAPPRATRRAALRRERPVIFVTVGGQLPFDRLVRAIDRWVGESERADVFAQIGASEYVPDHLEYERFLSPSQFEERLRAASVIVSHAGMGTILTALDHQRPVLVMPRRAALTEHRNDHQLATAAHLRERGLVQVAMDEEELARELAGIDRIEAAAKTSEEPLLRLRATLRDFVSGEPGRMA